MKRLRDLTSLWTKQIGGGIVWAINTKIYAKRTLSTTTYVDECKKNSKTWVVDESLSLIVGSCYRTPPSTPSESFDLISACLIGRK